MLPRVVSVWALFCLINLPGVAVQSTMAQDHIYYFDQKVPLVRNAGRLAVFDESANPDAVELLSGQGLQVKRWESHAITGWQLVELETEGGPDLIGAVDRIVEKRFFEFVTPVFVDGLGGPFFPTRNILLRFEPTVDDERQEQIVAESNLGTIIERNWANMPGAWRIRSHADNGLVVIEQANSLAEKPEVRWAEPDMVFTGRGHLIPDDPFFPDCWGLHNTGQLGVCQDVPGVADQDMDAPEAWDITVGDASIQVLVIDTGVEQDHPDVNQLAGSDFTSDVGDGGPVNSCDNHGTPVAGCVSAIINNGLGTVGVAPGCNSVSARCFISNLSCTGSWNAQYSWTADALAWAEANGVRVSNNSNRYGGTSSAVTDMYAMTRDNGMVHFASAGNGSSPIINYPANLPSVNAVAALNPRGELASFSDFGVGLAFSAPGQDVLTTDRSGVSGWVSGDYVCANGTSFASPYAAGTAALILSVAPALSAADVEQILQQSCVDLGSDGYDTTYGWGFVNAHEAVMAAMSCEESVGDLDGDGMVSLFDVDPFVIAITNGNYRCEADINEDGNVDLEDVEPFVELLIDD